MAFSSKTKKGAILYQTETVVGGDGVGVAAYTDVMDVPKLGAITCFVKPSEALITGAPLGLYGSFNGTDYVLLKELIANLGTGTAMQSESVDLGDYPAGYYKLGIVHADDDSAATVDYTVVEKAV